MLGGYNGFAKIGDGVSTSRHMPATDAGEIIPRRLGSGHQSA